MIIILILITRMIISWSLEVYADRDRVHDKQMILQFVSTPPPSISLVLFDK
jgi:hypothetical protein